MWGNYQLIRVRGCQPVCLHRYLLCACHLLRFATLWITVSWSSTTTDSWSTTEVWIVWWQCASVSDHWPYSFQCSAFVLQVTTHVNVGTGRWKAVVARIAALRSTGRLSARSSALHSFYHYFAILVRADRFFNSAYCDWRFLLRSLSSI